MYIYIYIMWDSTFVYIYMISKRRGILVRTTMYRFQPWQWPVGILSKVGAHGSVTKCDIFLPWKNSYHLYSISRMYYLIRIYIYTYINAYIYIRHIFLILYHSMSHLDLSLMKTCRFPLKCPQFRPIDLFFQVFGLWIPSSLWWSMCAARSASSRATMAVWGWQCIYLH